MVEISFMKATGAGNDFVIVDEFGSLFELDRHRFAKALCDRHFGIGADGLLLLRPHEHEDFEMQYYNADGSTGGMCGNGGRCAVQYVYDRGLAGGSMSFVALDFIYRAEVVASGVRLSMKDPVVVENNLTLRIGSTTYRGHLLDTGAPHVVIFSDSLEELDVVSVGRALRYHDALAPLGANINFVAVDELGMMSLRTYERGVENETLACGTGSVASATAGVLFGGLASPVSVRVRSGETLTVELRRDGDRVFGIVLEGSARMLFSGTCRYDPSAGRVSPIV